MNSAPTAWWMSMMQTGRNSLSYWISIMRPAVRKSKNAPDKSPNWPSIIRKNREWNAP